MSQSKPISTEGESGSTSTESDGNGSAFRVTIPKVYRCLTIFQTGTAVVFSTFLVTHLSAPALATVGGVDLTNRTIVFGRVYYQNKFLEPLVVFGALIGHVAAGIAKRSIKLYWKYKAQDAKKLTGEISAKIEKITTDEKDERGVVVRQKIITRTITTVTASYISRALTLLLPNHHTVGYALIPLVFGHVYLNRILPKRHFGDSSLINATYVTLSLRKWPRSSYLALTALIGLTAYHITSGAPVVYKILRGFLFKKNGGNPQTDSKRERVLRNGLIVTSAGLLAVGLLVIGGKIGKDPRIPLRTEYLKIYSQVYPQSWIRY